jgi:hypothetical protein
MRKRYHEENLTTREEVSSTNREPASDVNYIIRNERLIKQLVSLTTKQDRINRLLCFRPEPAEIDVVLKALGEYR